MYTHYLIMHSFFVRAEHPDVRWSIVSYTFFHFPILKSFIQSDLY
jgi:hypothetical protein